MNQEFIIDTLTKIGLSEEEVKIYVFLVRTGPRKAKDIVAVTKYSRIQVYRMLKNLQMKGMLEATLGHPSHFEALPPKKALDLLIQSKKREFNTLQKNKSNIIAALEQIQVTEPTTTIGKFAVIEGMDALITKSVQMGRDTRKELIMAHDKLSWAIEDFFGEFDEHLRSVIRKQSLLRLLTRASPENLEVINKILEKHKKSDMYFEVRHSELEPSRFPDYMIRDEEEILFSLTPYEDLTTTKPAKYRGLWTNNQSFIRAIKLLFEKSWAEAVDLKERKHPADVSSKS